MNVMIGEMAPQFRKFTEPMVEDVKKYVIKGRMDSAAIYPLLVNDYHQHTPNIFCIKGL